MAYTAPTSTATDFAMVTGYTPPLLEAVDFAFNPATGLPEVYVKGVLVTGFTMTDDNGIAIPGISLYYGSTQIF